MATKKPSVTKQIAEVLGTDDKREQLKKIEGLLEGAESPTVVLSVLFSKGKVNLSIGGDASLSGENIKFILSLAIDDITEQMVRAKVAQEELANEPLSSSGMPEDVLPEPLDTPQGA